MCVRVCRLHAGRSHTPVLALTLTLLLPHHVNLPLPAA
jgi:hypothetical protein